MRELLRTDGAEARLLATDFEEESAWLAEQRRDQKTNAKSQFTKPGSAAEGFVVDEVDGGGDEIDLHEFLQQQKRPYAQ